MPVLDLNLKTLKLIVDGMPKPKTFLFDTFFNDRENLDTEEVTIEFKSGRRLIAPMVDQFIPGQEMPKDTFTGRTFRPFKIAPQQTFTANEFAFERQAGENPFSPADPETRKSRKIANTFIEQTDQIARRWEKMAAEVLYDLTFTSEGVGVNNTVNYFDTAKKEHTTTETTTWNQTGSDPISDIKTILREIKANGGVRPTALILDPLASDLFQNNEKVLAQMNLRNAFFGEVRPEIDGVEGVAYIGNIPGLGVDLYEYQEYYDKYDPVTKKTTVEKIVPDYTVLFVPKGNQVKFGAESTIKDGLLTGSLIPRTLENEMNDTVEIRTISKPVLIPVNTKSLKVLKVK